ncbi:MAG: GNAT family protein [Pseudomonadota bacterium]
MQPGAPSFSRDLFQPLATQRLSLRALVPADADFILAHFSDPDVCRFLKDAEPLASRDEALGLIAHFSDPDRVRACRWGICLANGGRLIGTIGFLHWDTHNRAAEIGFDLARPWWGQGLMREALMAVIPAAHAGLKLNRIWAVVHLDNQRSLSTLHRLGFATEGVARELFRFRGAYHDHYCLSLLPRDWQAASGGQA